MHLDNKPISPLSARTAGTTHPWQKRCPHIVTVGSVGASRHTRQCHAACFDANAGAGRDSARGAGEKDGGVCALLCIVWLLRSEAAGFAVSPSGAGRRRGASPCERGAKPGVRRSGSCAPCRPAREPHLGTGWRISAGRAWGEACPEIGTMLLSWEAGRAANLGALGTGERAMGEKHLTEAALAGLRTDRRDCCEAEERSGGRAVT